jgi:hypothetical protein
MEKPGKKGLYTVFFDARASCFGVRDEYMFMVENGTVRVYDEIGEMYTILHSMTEEEKDRIRTLAVRHVRRGTRAKVASHGQAEHGTKRLGSAQFLSQGD